MSSYLTTFTGDGSEVHFTATFPVLRLSDLAVVVNNAWLVLGVDYLVSGSTASPLATLTTPPANGAIVVLRSAVGYTPTDPAAVTTAAPTLAATDTALWQAIGDRVSTETVARQAADAMIIASGETPANVSIAPVIARGSSDTRTVAAWISQLAYRVSVLEYASLVVAGDWTPAIQAAIDSVGAAGGGQVYLPPGTYTCAGTTPILIAYDNVELIGSGPASTIHFESWRTWTYVPATRLNMAQICAYKVGAAISNVRIAHLRFTSHYDYVNDHYWFNGSGGTPVWTIMFAGNLGGSEVAINCGVEYCTFNNTGGSCIGASNGYVTPTQSQTRGFYARNNYIDNTIFAAVDVDSGGVGSADVSGNTIRHTSGAGIVMSASQYIIHGNMIEYTKGTGIATSGNSIKEQFSLITGNNLFRCGEGKYGVTDIGAFPSIHLGDGSTNNRCAVTNNVITSAYGSGIHTSGSNTDDLVITNNIIHEFGKGAVGRSNTIPGGAFTGISCGNGLRQIVMGNLVMAGVDAGDLSEFGITNGGTISVASLTDGNTTIGTFTQKSFALPGGYGANGSGSTTRVGRSNFDLTASKYADVLNRNNTVECPVLGDNSPTPNIQGFGAWWVGYSSPTTITNILGACIGQELTLVFQNANVTIADGGSFSLNGAFTSANNAVLKLVYMGGVWLEVSRSMN